MKNSLLFVVLLTAISYGYCDDSYWQWGDCDSKHWSQYLLHNNKEEDYPCREPESKKMGIVDKETGQCFLPVSEESVESYQIVNQTFSGYFQWRSNDDVSCYSALNSHSEPNITGSYDNCIDDSERLCRFKSNDVWIFGIENKYECVHSEHIRTWIYELYAFNIFKYQMYEFMGRMLAYGIWMVTLFTVYCGTYLY